MIASSAFQLSFHGPVAVGAHSTVAMLKGGRLVHSNSPFPIKGSNHGNLAQSRPTRTGENQPNHQKDAVNKFHNNRKIL